MFSILVLLEYLAIYKKLYLTSEIRKGHIPQSLVASFTFREEYNVVIIQTL